MDELNNLWHRLTAPRATDENEARREYMVRAMLIIMSAVIFVAIIPVTIGWSRLGAFSLNNLMVLVLLNLLFGGGWGLAHRGHWRLSSYVLPTGAFLLALYSNYFGVGNPAMLYYAVAIVLTAILHGVKAQWVTLGLSIAAYLSFGWAHMYGPLYPPSGPGTSLAGWATEVSTALITITLLQWFATHQFRRTLAQSRAYATELAEHKADLEEQVAARTAEITRQAEVERQAREDLELIITAYSAFIQRVAQGDLRIQLNVANDDNLGRLGLRLNSMVLSLHELATQTVTAAQSIATATGEILAATAQQVSSAQAQATTIAQTTSTITEIKTVAEEMAERAQDTADLADQTATVSQDGVQAVRDTIQGMTEIQTRAAELAETILTLSENSQQIGAIIATVEGIAAQSRMLALNAAVEAARAGEAGHGFAVVAQEVRALAERSRAATAQVRDIIQDIQRATDAAVLTTEEVSKSVQRGETLTTQAGEVIVKLSSRIQAAAHAARQIVASAGQQVGGLEQITGAMSDLNSATQQTVGSVNQTERAGQDLHKLAQQMTQLVAQYQLE